MAATCGRRAPRGGTGGDHTGEGEAAFARVHSGRVRPGVWDSTMRRVDGTMLYRPIAAATLARRGTFVTDGVDTKPFFEKSGRGVAIPCRVADFRVELRGVSA